MDASEKQYDKTRKITPKISRNIYIYKKKIENRPTIRRKKNDKKDRLLKCENI